MELGIIIVYSNEMSVYRYLDIQFFFNLTMQSLFWSLALLNLAAGKFPPVLEFAVSSLSSEIFIIVADYCCYYIYCFHDIHSLYTAFINRAIAGFSNCHSIFIGKLP